MATGDIKLIAFLSFVKSSVYCLMLKSWWPITLLLADINYLNGIDMKIYYLQEWGTAETNGIDSFPTGKWHVVV